MNTPTNTWLLKGKDGTRYARLLGLVQRGNTWFAQLQPEPAYERVRPMFDAMVAHLESHGVPASLEGYAALRDLGLHVEDPDGKPHAVKDLFVAEELATFSMPA